MNLDHFKNAKNQQHKHHYTYTYASVYAYTYTHTHRYVDIYPLKCLGNPSLDKKMKNFTLIIVYKAFSNSTYALSKLF